MRRILHEIRPGAPHSSPRLRNWVTGGRHDARICRYDVDQTVDVGSLSKPIDLPAGWSPRSCLERTVSCSWPPAAGPPPPGGPNPSRWPGRPRSNPSPRSWPRSMKRSAKTCLINVQGGGSTAGVKAAETGTAQIGMSSRQLKSSEKGLTSIVIAHDGIAIIVHRDNPVSGLGRMASRPHLRRHGVRLDPLRRVRPDPLRHPRGGLGHPRGLRGYGHGEPLHLPPCPGAGFQRGRPGDRRRRPAGHRLHFAGPGRPPDQGPVGRRRRAGRRGHPLAPLRRRPPVPLPVQEPPDRRGRRASSTSSSAPAASPSWPPKA